MILFNVDDKNGNSLLKINDDGNFFIKNKLITDDKNICRYITFICKRIYTDDIKESILYNPELMQEILEHIRNEKMKKIT